MTYLVPLFGGVLIGVAASLLLWFNGRVAGITGVLAELLNPRATETSWRLVFLAGMGAGAAVLALAYPAAFGTNPNLGLGGVAAAGLIVGVGTRMGNGCTSGHGVCGIPRGSVRSIVATITFIAAGALTVWLVGGVA